MESQSSFDPQRASSAFTTAISRAAELLMPAERGTLPVTSMSKGGTEYPSALNSQTIPLM